MRFMPPESVSTPAEPPRLGRSALPGRRKAALAGLTAFVFLAHAMLLELSHWQVPTWSLPQGAPAMAMISLRPASRDELPRASTAPAPRALKAAQRPAPVTRAQPGAPRGEGEASAVATSGPTEAEISGLAMQLPDLSEPAVELARVNLPGVVNLSFKAERGGATGQAELHWEQSGAGEAYTLEWNVSVPGKPEIEWRSSGELGDAGLRPARMVERRKGRETASVNYQRDKGYISFSGPPGIVPLPPGVQDRASWLVQLPLLAQAAGDDLAEGSGLRVPVATVRGELLYWVFVVDHADTLKLSTGETLRTWVLVREPDRPYDARIEIALARDRSMWPLRIVWGPMPGKEPLILTLQEGLPPPPPPAPLLPSQASSAAAP
jgi:hypothetical protein